GKSLRQFRVPVEGPARRHVISPDGKSWASVSGDRWNIVIWDAATGNKHQLLAVNQSWIGAMAFSPDSRTLYTWSGYKRVCSWNIATGKKVGEFGAGDEHRIYTGSFSPNGHWFACAGPEQVLLRYDMSTGKAVRRIDVPSMRYDNRTLAFSPD